MWCMGLSLYFDCVRAGHKCEHLSRLFSSSSFVPAARVEISKKERYDAIAQVILKRVRMKEKERPRRRWCARPWIDSRAYISSFPLQICYFFRSKEGYLLVWAFAFRIARRNQTPPSPLFHKTTNNANAQQHDDSRSFFLEQLCFR